jgi:hypothetical protein
VAGAVPEFRIEGVEPMPRQMTASTRQIYYWFMLSGTPQGGAPVDVRAQWDGVVVPVREPRPMEGPTPYRSRQVGDPQVRRLIDDGVPVHGDDAVRALHLFSRPAACAWWRDYFDARPANSRLVFRSYEGRLVPPSYALAQYPELADFDDP